MYFVVLLLVHSALSASEYTETINVQDYLSNLASKNLPRLPDLNKEPYPNLFEPALANFPNGASRNDRIQFQIQPAETDLHNDKLQVQMRSELVEFPNSGNLGKTVPLVKDERKIEFQIQPEFQNLPLPKNGRLDIQTHIQPELVAVSHGDKEKSRYIPKNDGSEFQLIRKQVPRTGNLHLSPPLSKTEDLPNTSHLTYPRPEIAPYPDVRKIQDGPLPLLPKELLKIPYPPFVKDFDYVPPATVKPLPSYSDLAKWDIFKKPDLKDIADHPKTTKFPKSQADILKLPALSDFTKLAFPNLAKFTLPDFSKFLPTLPDVPLSKLQPLPPLKDNYNIQFPSLSDLSRFPQLPLPDLSVFASQKSEKAIKHDIKKRSYDLNSNLTSYSVTETLINDRVKRSYDYNTDYQGGTFGKSRGLPGMDELFKALKMPNLNGWAIPDVRKLKDLQISKIPDIDLGEYILSQGYPVELHEIVTEDGYILGTYRIPHGRHATSKSPNPYPIMVNHGIMGSAENFIIGGPEKALPFVLADHGFDVWLMNARGAWHSRKHQHLNPDKDKEFWKFTFHEIGYYDLPATIDYITHVTGQHRMHYIGHSQGTTVFFVMASERPEYNARIKLMIAMAPSVILQNIPDPTVQLGAPLYPQLLKMVESSKFYEQNPPQIITNQAMRSILRSICGEHGDPSICLNMFKAMSYGVGDQIDIKTIPLITATVLGGASNYQSVHFAQIVATGKFEQMDWGEKENLKRYHQPHPPAYNLQNVVCPVALLYAKNDGLIAVKDVMTLAHLLPNVVDLYKVPYENWTHMDFVWAKSLDKYLNPHLLELLHKYLE